MAAPAGRIIGVGLLLGATCSAAAGAQPRELDYSPAVDSVITVTAAGIWSSSELLKGKLAPRTCRWCATTGLDSSVRSALRWSAPDAADKASNVTAFLATPLLTLGADALAAEHQHALGRAPLDTWFVAEATLIALGVCNLIKFAAARERPFVHALAADRKGATADASDNNLSFVSGHATATFAMASAAGTVATLRHYQWAPIVWAAGFGGAVTTGYLRIAADKHWLTDVLGGSALGVAVGVGATALLHRPSSASGTATLAAPLQIAFVW